MNASNSDSATRKTLFGKCESSSGFPGVSWNKRMKAWLAFFYSGNRRRNKTFNPRNYSNSKEAARLAAIEFMKSLPSQINNQSAKSQREFPSGNMTKIQPTSPAKTAIARLPYNAAASAIKQTDSKTNKRVQPELSEASDRSGDCVNSDKIADTVFVSPALCHRLMFSTSNSFSSNPDVESTIYEYLISNDDQNLPGFELPALFHDQQNFKNRKEAYSAVVNVRYEQNDILTHTFDHDNHLQQKYEKAETNSQYAIA